MTELAAPFQMSQPAISKHLKVLERAGLISRGRDAAAAAVPARGAGPLRDATAWLEDFRLYWEESYQRLDALLRLREPAPRKDGTAELGDHADRPGDRHDPRPSPRRRSWSSTRSPSLSC